MKSMDTLPLRWFRAFAIVFSIGFLFLILGAFLTMTVIGAIFGIPLILAGIVTAIASPFAKWFMVEGKCPYCESKVETSTFREAVKCRVCRKRMVFRDRKFVAIA